MPADCGELVSKGEPEREFNPNLVRVVEGSCSIQPREGTPEQVRTFIAEVENPNPNTDVRADVHWALQEVPGRPALARTTVERIFRNGRGVASATAAPVDVDEVPDEFRSRVRAILVPGSVREVGFIDYP